MANDIRARLENCSQLPSMPAVAIRLLDLCQQDEPELAEIAALLSHDPALTAKLLRLTNSPAFGLKSKVSTVSHATMILGLNAIQTLALSFSLVRNLQQRHHQPMKWFWRRSLLSAVAARETAIATGCLQSEEAFLGALLQDIGILALQQLNDARYGSQPADASLDHERLVTAEHEAFGEDHATIGGWLCERWKLPAVLSTAVAASHDPATLPASTHPDIARVACIVALSGLIAEIWMHEDTATATAAARAASAQYLGLPAATLDRVLLGVTENAKEVAVLFDVSIDSQEEMVAILERAKETLLLLAIEANRRATDAQQTIGELEDKARSLEQEAHRDRLTGIFNRAFFDRALDGYIDLVRSKSLPVSLLFVDIDHFKTVNDTYGHLAGDRVLAAVAQGLASQLRSQDLAARFGGEEFVVILSGAGPAEAASVAERMRRSVANASYDIGEGKRIQVTVSLGVASLPPQATVVKEAFIAAADGALYAAKRNGRNRFVAAEMRTEAGTGSI
jgi:diguanylate cyclase (GGDEF)-like protein